MSSISDVDNRPIRWSHILAIAVWSKQYVCLASFAIHYHYTGAIRPVLEYATPVWDHLLSKTQIDQIEAIQRRALRIIYSYTNGMPYINALYCASIPSLVDRREQLSRKFFTSILQPSSCLHTLLPTPRDPIITTRLRSANKFPRLPSRTRKYQTFISYARCIFHCTALLCYLVLQPQSWINSTTTTTVLWPNGWWIKMPLGTEVGLGPGDMVLDGDPAPPTDRGTAASYFSAHVYCGETVAHLSNCCALVFAARK